MCPGQFGLLPGGREPSGHKSHNIHWIPLAPLRRNYWSEYLCSKAVSRRPVKRPDHRVRTTRLYPHMGIKRP